MTMCRLQFIEGFGLKELGALTVTLLLLLQFEFFLLELAYFCSLYTSHTLGRFGPRDRFSGDLA